MQNKPQMVEAVVFFDAKGVCKQMLFPEFEALLDGVVNLPEFSDQQVRAAYVVINPRLQVRACVFFCLDFDVDGAADRGWNIPLQHMAERAGRGPDLGAGPIRMACRSQCPVAWHQMHLWDPNLSPESSDLTMLRDAIARNQLGLLIEEEAARPVDPQRLHIAAEEKWYGADGQPVRAARPDQAQRDKAARIIHQQRLRITAMTRQHEQELAKIKFEAQTQLQTVREQLVRAEAALSQQQRLNATLKAQLDAQAAQFERSREELGRKLNELEQNGRAANELLRSQFEAEAQARVNAAVAELREQLDVRDVELAYRKEIDLQQQARIKKLKQERDTYASQGADETLARLAKLGVVFVVYHPGAGHLTIALQDLARYQDNPLAYAAAKCFVSEEQYRLWLAHYEEPLCRAELPGNQVCALPIERVETPARYIHGDSNCCSRHKKPIHS